MKFKMAKCGNPSVLWPNIMDFKKGIATTSSKTAAAGTLNADTFIMSIDCSSNTIDAGTEMTVTMTNKAITADTIPMVSVGWGTGGTVGMGWVTVTANQLVITITNLHASTALAGTVVIYGLMINPRI